MEGRAVRFSDIIEEQLQLEGMWRSLPKNTHTETVRTQSASLYLEDITSTELNVTREWAVLQNVLGTPLQLFAIYCNSSSMISNFDSDDEGQKHNLFI